MINHSHAFQSGSVRGDKAFRRSLQRNLSSALGLFLITLCLALAASLATWQASDPSWSNAVTDIPQNLLGMAGSTLSDFFMQTIGLGSSILLLPPMIWSWRLLSGKNTFATRWRFGSWIGGLFAFSLALSLLPVPGGWALHTGLGGVLGDGFISLINRISGNSPSTLASILLFSAFVGLCLVLYRHALNLNWSPLRKSRSAVEFTDHSDRAPEQFADEETEEIDLKHYESDGRQIDQETGLIARVFSKNGSSRNPEIPSGLSKARQYLSSLFEDDEDVLDQFTQGNRQEPTIGNNPDSGPANATNLDNYDEDENYPDPELVQTRHPTGIKGPDIIEKPRVAQSARRPREGKRIVREAQGSMFRDRASYELPNLHLLAEAKSASPGAGMTDDALEQNARLLEGVLGDFGIRGEIIKVRPGPVVTLYELEPAPGIKSSRVIGLADDIARSMSAISARVAVVPGRNVIGIELPNSRRETVYMREMLSSRDFEATKAKLPICLGKNIGGEPVIVDLARMPHLLVAGTTGSGKSVSINTMILSLLYRLTPEQCRLIMIDPKMLELSIYDGIPHLLSPVVTDPQKAVVALKWAVREMEDRYKKMSKLTVRNIDGFNLRITQALKKGEVITRTIQTGFDPETGEAVYEQEDLVLETLPYIVILVDEMADLMMVAGKDIEGTIQRLAQMARAAGIHLIMATQRPSVDVITGTIKANFPTRISFQVTSKIDSRTILGEMGAEQLLGQGDMLYMASGGRTQRVHGPFVSDEEVEQIVNHLKDQGTPEYLEAVTLDDEPAPGSGYEGLAGGSEESNDLYDQAVAIVLRDRKASTSYVQRRLSIGYNRAASIIERMEEEGLISAANHAGRREILVPDSNEAA